ncbi:solute carrier family 22 member 15-like [Ruditapes philippinarum]|uniref:solute carrier family 22 member 15-like n=1 Tax=Ruditapes philippinarum TaxID=129788 RepID=UPI00295B2510|nr:solute carrier family 22 member 15-like [Ruditapes philippinarum]
MPDLSSISQMGLSTNTQLKDKNYSLIDILKNKKLRKYTLLLVFIWVELGMGAYGIQFGVSALSGNLYINMFIIGLIGVPVQLMLIPLQNRFGRKKTAKLFFMICAIFAFIFAITRYLDETNIRNKVSNAAALISLTAISASWSPIQTLTIEIYPTVVRNIGYGFQNTMARVGAVIGPQLVFLDTRVPGMMYWICGVSAVVSIFLLWPIPETMGADLTDKLTNTKKQSNAKNKETRDYCDPDGIVSEVSEKSESILTATHL